MSEKETNNYETIAVIKKRLELLVGAKFKPKDSIMEASRKIDDLRDKYGEEEDGYNSVEIIRKWRKEH